MVTRLYKIRPDRNEYRFYTIKVQPDLFGGVSVVREWGRVGQPGQVRIDNHGSNVQAHKAFAELYDTKSKGGYKGV